MPERNQTALQRVRCRVSKQAGRLLSERRYNKEPDVTVSDSPPPSPSTPPPTSDGPAAAAAKAVEEIAQQYRDAIAVLQAIMPLLKFDSRQTRRVAASAKFAPGLIEPTIAMVTSASPARERNMFNVNDGELALELRSQIAPLFQQLASLAADGLFTIDSKLALSSVHALQTYKWAQHAAAQPDGAELHPYLAEMERFVMKVLNRRKRSAPVSTPTPDPTPAPSPSQLPPGARGFLAPSLTSAKTAEPENVADSFDKALDDVTKK